MSIKKTLKRVTDVLGVIGEGDEAADRELSRLLSEREHGMKRGPQQGLEEMKWDWDTPRDADEVGREMLSALGIRRDFFASWSQGRVVLTAIGDVELSFDLLERVSRFFGTRQIDISVEGQWYGGAECIIWVFRDELPANRDK